MLELIAQIVDIHLSSPQPIEFQLYFEVLSGVLAGPNQDMCIYLDL